MPGRSSVLASAAPGRRKLSQRSRRVRDAHSNSATVQPKYRRLTVLGLWLVSASLVSGLLCQVMWIVEIDRFLQPRGIASDNIDSPPDRPRVVVHLAYVLADVGGLGIPVQRRRCRDCRQVQCVCVVWRAAREGRRA